jgi:hypothetical protein
MELVIAILVFWGFVLVRTAFGLLWNDVLCNKALAEDGPSTWYLRSSPTDWIFNPLRWYMWTPGQYERFLRKRYPN